MRAGLIVVLLAACGGGGGEGDGGAGDATIGADADPLDPMTLADTGLYLEDGVTLADGVRPYTPRWHLWSDGADKGRWIQLPGDIDSTDMDYWVYPVGTKAWKEFSLDGTRIETRLLWKQTDTTWFMRAYVWNAEQTQAFAAPDGLTDAMGTTHDVPAPEDCQKCHNRMPDKLLGFTALQLDYDPPGSSDVSLDDLVTGGELSAPITRTDPDYYFPMPADPTGTIAPALGYLHGNCGGCHHPQSDVHDVVGLELRLTTAFTGDWADTPPYQTAVNQQTELTVITAGLDKIVDPGNPTGSIVHYRMNRRGQYQMPPLATEEVDTDAVAAVDAWINDL
ncbi:MAG TPA: hypothetical protein VL172_19710 [Kofleriaceae bacterium]|jgi:hypothetical protein|nr:hypothetical protein [Kofleriaceae bacterium]